MIEIILAGVRGSDPETGMNTFHERQYVLADDFRALRAAYAEAIQDISDWAGYASEYFKEKHDLAGILKLHNDRLAGFQSDGGGEHGSI